MTVEEVQPVSALRCKKKNHSIHKTIAFHSVAKKFRFACVFIVRFGCCGLRVQCARRRRRRLTIAHATNTLSQCRKIGGTTTGNYVRTNSSSSSALRKKHVDQTTEWGGHKAIAAVVATVVIAAHRAESKRNKATATQNKTWKCYYLIVRFT